jgi:hypothetical protein
MSATEFEDVEAQIQPEPSGSEETPLLHSKINPNSAIYYRQITLPSSSAMTRQRKPSEKKKRKEFFEASQLATDLYADQKQIPVQVPEIRLPDAQADVSKSL